MTIKEANKITGGLSFPSKMPCPAYSLPTSSCKMGSALRLVKNSTCSKCYACKGRYNFSNVRNALKKRENSLNDTRWEEAMIFLINHYKNDYFRWHDSGDIKNSVHLGQIMEVVEGTPNVLHRMPTKQWKIVNDYLFHSDIPSNLNIRLSSPFINMYPEYTDKLEPLSISVVVSSIDEVKTGAFLCPATANKTSCEDCRACWKKSVKCVCYLLH